MIPNDVHMTLVMNGIEDSQLEDYLARHETYRQKTLDYLSDQFPSFIRLTEFTYSQKIYGLSLRSEFFRDIKSIYYYSEFVDMSELKDTFLNKMNTPRHWFARREEYCPEIMCKYFWGWSCEQLINHWVITVPGIQNRLIMADDIDVALIRIIRIGFKDKSRICLNISKI